jgi:hypothetical protein
MHLRSFKPGLIIFLFLSVISFSIFTQHALAQETSESDLDNSFQPTPGPSEQKESQPVPIPSDIPPPANYEPDAAKPSDLVDSNTPSIPDDVQSADTKIESPKEPVVENNSHKICDCKFSAGTPYRERRPALTGIFGIEAGQYQPVNYIPQVGSQANKVGAFPSYYGGSSSPNVEVVFGAKYNFFLGSLGGQIGGGFYSASNSTDSASFSVYPLTVGATYQMDTIFKEPYVVPYVTVGAYTDFYNESAGGISASGHSGIGAFYSLGMLFQLDWIDEEAHDSGYTDFGIENTFLFLEARSFIATQDVAIDFSTPLQISGGLKFEF